MTDGPSTQARTSPDRTESEPASFSELHGGGLGTPDKPATVVRFLKRTIPLELVGIVLILGAWTLVVASGMVSQRLLPSPLGIVEHTWQLATEGYRGDPLTTHVWASIRRTAIGFSLAVVTGVPAGLAMGRYKPLAAFFGPILALLRPIPAIAWIPLAVLYLGLGEASKIVLIYMAPFMFIVLNAEAGVRSVPAILIRAGQMLGYTRRQLFVHVIFPGSLPSVMSGIRTGAAVSWALVVAAELIAARTGLGYMVASAGNFFDIETVYSGIALIGIIGFSLDTAARKVEEKVLHWRGR